MSECDILATYRRLMPTVDERVRWACALEATAPKLGNVHPGRRFTDLACGDFLYAGDALASAIADGGGIGMQIHQAVVRCHSRCGTNVNLGIALLVVPLAAAEKLAAGERTNRRACLQRVLANLTEEDCRHVYAAIRTAAPGGMGTVDAMDIHDDAPADLVAAMRLAADRDSVARQYVTGFGDLYDRVIPALRDEIQQCGDLLIGIRRAHLRVMAAIPDTLIGRKRGVAVASASAARAARVVATEEAEQRWREEMALDAWLRSDDHARNPGTSADLIAAGLFVLLAGDEELESTSTDTTGDR